MSDTPTQRAWINMRLRCYDEKTKDFHLYGGRGIQVCDRWLKSFDAFLADMGPRPEGKYSLDRWPNKNGNYEPGNCRWATWIQQANNRNNNVMFVVDGREISIAEAASRMNISHHAIRRRLKKGWPIDRAISAGKYERQIIT